MQANEGSDLSFVQNNGQWSDEVKYKSTINGGAVFLTQTGFRYAFYNQEQVAHLHNHSEQENATLIDHHAYDVLFDGCKQAEVSAREKRAYHHNYFLGSDRSKWASDVHLYGLVDYKELYHNIDLNIYSTGNSLKYDLVVLPGGNTNDIRLRFDGVTPKLNEAGDLVIKTTVNTVVEKAPYVYQIVEDKKVVVPCVYSIENGVVSFVFPEGYDKSRILVIDPVLIFATYTGSTGNVWGYCSAFDRQGNFFAASQAQSTGYPVGTGAYKTTYVNHDVAISKYNPAGSVLMYATYCGGINADVPTSMVFNRNNELVLSGYTSSPNYPTTSNAFDTSYNLESDIFVTVFSLNGSSLVGSTYLGGSGHDGISTQSITTIGDGDKNIRGLVVDNHMNIYVATSTESKDYPVTTGVYQSLNRGGKDGCVTKLSRSCNNLIYSTYLGGGNTDCIFDCKLKTDYSIVVSGLTYSDNFPLTSNAYSDTGHAFICILDTAGVQLKSSTLLGSHSISAVKLSIDHDENIYACGINDTNFVVSSGVHKQTLGRVYIAKMTSDLDTMLLSTKVVDTDVPVVMGFSDVCGDVVAMVFTRTIKPQPLTSNAFLSNPTVYYILHLNPTFDTLQYGSYFGTLADSTALGSHMHGSSVVDSSGVIYISACNSLTKSRLVGTSGSYSPTSSSSTNDNDHYSAKFDVQVKAARPISVPIVPDTGCVGVNVFFLNDSKNAYNYIWYFGDGDTSHAVKPVHKFDTIGTYTVKLEAYNPFSCKLMHSATKVIYIDSLKMIASAIIPDTMCQYDQVYMVNKTVKGITYLWDFGDGVTDTTFHGQHAYGQTGEITVKLISYNSTLCNHTDTFYHKIYIDGENPQAGFTFDKSKVCVGMPIQFQNTTVDGVSYAWDFGDNKFSASTNPTHSYEKWGTLNVKLIATNTKLCVPKDTADVTVTVLEPLRIQLVDTFICESQIIDINVRLLHSNTNVKYSWSPANAILSATNTQKITVNPDLSNRYVVTVSDSIPGMCSHVVKDSIYVLIVEYPEDISITTNEPICEGDTLQLVASVSPYIDRLNYAWSGPGKYTAYDSVASRENVTRIHSGTYELFVDNQGCEVSKKIEVDINPIPNVEVTNNSPILAGDSLLLKMTADIEWDSVFWSGPSGFSSELPNPTIYEVKPANEGAYTLKVVAKGCVGGAITHVTVNDVDSQYVRLYPNPNNGRFFIEGKGLFEQEVRLVIVNSVGQKIFLDQVYTGKKHFKEEVVLSGAASGEYILWLLLDGEYWTIPFVIARDNR